MSLSSVFSTAISGLTASETTINVDGNNVANANTVGYKASEALFATQFVQTLSQGSAPAGTDGGTNPEQTGLGVEVAAITPDFTQGSLQTTSNPSDLAIQGDGFFTVQATTGQQLYTRDGQFQLNANNQLVNDSGGLLLGYGVDANFNIQATQLHALSIPLGSTTVAKATENVTMQGALSPTGDVANTAQIQQSQILGDAAFTAPTNATTAVLSDTPGVATSTATPSTAVGGGLTSGSQYQYKIVFVDDTGTQSTPSSAITVTTGATDNEVTLGNIPQDAKYSQIEVYRTDANGSTFKPLATFAMGQASYTDTTSDATMDAAAGANTLNTSTLSGNYSYYITYANAFGGPGTGIESRPSQVIGPLNVVNGRVQLENIPSSVDPEWKSIRIYRNSSTNASTFTYVGELPNTAGQSYTDSASDASIANNAQIDMNGPRATSNTLLTNVLVQGDNGPQNLFQVGTLNYTGTKGGNTLTTKSLQITAKTTLLDLTTFMQQASGIQVPPGTDIAHPIPSDASGATPGGSVNANGQIQIVSNDGTNSAVSVGLSGFTETNASGTQQVNLQFSTTQNAIGSGATANFVVYDSLGIPINVAVTTELQSTSATQSVFRWYADSPQNSPTSGNSVSVGTGLLFFNGQGQLISSTNSTVAVERAGLPSNSPLTFNLNFSGVSGLAATTDSLNATEQDGFAPGQLTSYTIGTDGIIKGSFSNGTQRNLGQIQLANFANPDGLVQQGLNLYSTGVNSGLAVIGNANTDGNGSIVSGAVELSNTDLGQSLTELITASSQYQANARVISAADQLLTDLLQLGQGAT